MAGEHYFLNEELVASSPDLICFPSYHGVPNIEPFRHQWILRRRVHPYVPCPENTPMPSRKMSKDLRSKLLSVYLRSWTLVPDSSILRRSQELGKLADVSPYHVSREASRSLNPHLSELHLTQTALETLYTGSKKRKQEPVLAEGARHQGFALRRAGIMQNENLVDVCLHSSDRAQQY